MPTPKTLPSADAFAGFTAALLSRGFREILRARFKKDAVRLGLSPPSARKGQETGFSYSAHNLEVIVWTTFLEDTHSAREKDAGWVLIREADERCYFKLVPRTRHFLHNLLGHAAIAKCRVENRPLCLVCGRYMKITQGKGLKSRYWSCKNPSVHLKTVSLSWDYGLTKEMLDFLKPFRERRARYQSELKKQGGTPGTALRNRRGWKMARPENKVQVE